MPKYNIEDILGWEDDNGRVLCYECSEKELNNDEAQGWSLIEEKNTEDYLYVCDICHSKV